MLNLKNFLNKILENNKERVLGIKQAKIIKKTKSLILVPKEAEPWNRTESPEHKIYIKMFTP